MGAGHGHVARHGVLVDIDQAAGGSCPAAFPDVLQDGEGLVVGQSGVLQDGPLAFGEGALQVRQWTMRIRPLLPLKPRKERFPRPGGRRRGSAEF